MRGKQVNRLVLIDGKNFVFRHHHTHKQLRSNNQSTSVLFGCPSGLLALHKKFPDTPLVFVWDGIGKTWRHKLLQPSPAAKDVIAVKVPETAPKQAPAAPVERPQGYKAHREQQKAPVDVIEACQQIPYLKELFRQIGIRQFEVNKLEGDDLIGILATYVLEKGWFDEVVIHSTDKDFYQFLPNPKIRVLRNLQDGQLVWADAREIEMKFGVKPSQWCAQRAITGEDTDNIPHLFAGIGPKKAAAFIHAGLDPACSKYEQQRVEVQQKFKTHNLQFPARWDEVHRNYLLSRIVTDPNFRLLAVDVKEALEKLIRDLKSDSFYRGPTSEKGWQYLNWFLARYELGSLYDRRRELWSLP